MEQMLLSDSPIARKTDPVSSHEAAAEVTASGARATQQAEVLRGVKEYPGRTSKELAHLIGCDRYLVARRLPELARKGLVQRGHMVTCKIGGRKAVTWFKGEC